MSGHIAGHAGIAVLEPRAANLLVLVEDDELQVRNQLWKLDALGSGGQHDIES